MRARFINEGEYWDESSKYFPEYESYYNELVPPIGAANTLQGETLRNMSRIMYDYYNNGFCNDRTPEVYFLKKHQNLFKPYMKNPYDWDSFYQEYGYIGFGEDGTSNYLNEKKIEQLMDNIMDGIIKYIRLTENNLIPYSEEEEG